MELEQLRQFLKVAELESFTRAADAVALSQPALSRSVARLEEEFGVPLFERQTRRVVLTDAGRLLQGRARQILSLVDDARSEVCDDGSTGTLRIGAIPTIAPYFLPAHLRAFQQLHPLARVIVQEETTERLLKNLTDGAIDLAIAALPIHVRYVEVTRLFDEELLVVLAAEHPLAQKKTIRLTEIESLPFVLLGEAHCLSDNVVSFCQQKAFHPVTVERTSQLAMVQELVSLNHGVSLIPRMAQRQDASPRRVYRSMAGAKPQRTVVMVSNPYRYQSRLLKRFMSLLTAAPPEK